MEKPRQVDTCRGSVSYLCILSGECLGVVCLNDIQEIALLSDAEICKGLVNLTGLQRRAVEMHSAGSVVDAVVLKDGAESGVFVNDNGLSLNIVTNSYLNHKS